MISQLIPGIIQMEYVRQIIGLLKHHGIGHCRLTLVTPITCSMFMGRRSVWPRRVWRQQRFPAVFLKSDVKIASGTGEKDNPYKLSL